MAIYIDTNVFYNAYCPTEDSATADWILEQLTTNFPGITCEWTISEIFRAFRKQINLDVIEEDKVQDVIDFFLSEIAEMTQSKVLLLVPITLGAIMATRPLIFAQNLYAVDAMHAVIAANAQVKGFITYDCDFKGDLRGIPVLYPLSEAFQANILQLKGNSE